MEGESWGIPTQAPIGDYKLVSLSSEPIHLCYIAHLVWGSKDIQFVEYLKIQFVEYLKKMRWVKYDTDLKWVVRIRVSLQGWIQGFRLVTTETF